MKDFYSQIANGFIIEKVNLPKVEISDAINFKKHLDTNLSLGYKTVIVDLSECNSLDPAFMGVMVITLKQLMKSGGTIKIVKPGLFSTSLLNFTGTIEMFELYESIENAIASITISSQRVDEFNSPHLDQLAVIH